MTTDAAVLETQASAPAETQPAAVTAPDTDLATTQSAAVATETGTAPLNPAGTDLDGAGTDSPDAPVIPNEATDLETLKQAAERRGEERGQTKAQLQAVEDRRRAELNASIEGTRQVFSTYAPAIRSHLAAVQRGEADLNVDGVLNAVNAIAGAAGPAEGHKFLSAVHEFADGLLSPDGAKEFKTENDAAVLSQKGWRSLFDNLKGAMQEHARQGYIKADDLDAIKAEARVQARQELRKDKDQLRALLEQIDPPASRSGVTGGNSSGGHTPKDIDEARLMVSNMHPRGLTMTTAQFRAWQQTQSRGKG